MNLEEHKNNPFYYEEKEDKVIMSTNRFIEIIKYKTNLPCRNKQAIFAEARKTGLVEYHSKKSIVNNKYGQFRVCCIRKSIKGKEYIS